MQVSSDGPYAFGATVTLSVALEVKGVPTDPGDVTLSYKAPGQTGVTTVPNASLNHDGYGLFSYALVVTTAGEWHYRFVSTGAAAGSAESEFQVNRLETV